MQIYKYLVLISAIHITNCVNAQSVSQQEQVLKLLFDSLYAKNEIRFIRSDDEMKRINDTILLVFEKSLRLEGAIDSSFSSIVYIKNLRSPSGKVRIITWNLKLNSGKYMYYGFVQYRHPIKKVSYTWPLKDLSDSITAPLTASLGPENWYGALYYGMYEYSAGGKDYYVLFGWDGYSYYTNRKMLEIMTISAYGKPLFGKPVFKASRKTYKRLIFEYSIKAVMNLHFDMQANAIVFDHLASAAGKPSGDYKFYGPDGTSDGFILKKDKWYFIDDIYVTNPKGPKREYAPPKL